MYCVFTVCLYVNVYKYMGLSIKWVSPYMYLTHIQPPCLWVLSLKKC